MMERNSQLAHHKLSHIYITFYIGILNIRFYSKYIQLFSNLSFYFKNGNASKYLAGQGNRSNSGKLSFNHLTIPFMSNKVFRFFLAREYSENNQFHLILTSKGVTSKKFFLGIQLYVVCHYFSLRKNQSQICSQKIYRN